MTIHRLCASCGRAGLNQALPWTISVIRRRESLAMQSYDIVGLCADCADPARFSTNQLADAIIAEFQRQLSPTKKGTTQ